MCRSIFFKQVLKGAFFLQLAQPWSIFNKIFLKIKDSARYTKFYIKILIQRDVTYELSTFIYCIEIY